MRLFRVLVTFFNAASHWTEGFLLGSGGGSSTSSYSSAADDSRTRRVMAETENMNSLAFSTMRRNSGMNLYEVLMASLQCYSSSLS